MSPPEPTTTAALLAQSAWLHRLALRLASDAAGADDAAQQTLVRALERPPAARVPLRSWLATVLRNVVRQEKRGGARRAARELARPRETEAEPADELAARLELHGKLLAAVRALREPYRTTVALRFLEDLPASEVARRMDVPVKTVHARLERALVELRERLDRELGGRSAWAALLVTTKPAVPTPPPEPALFAPGPALLAPLLAMGTTLWKWAGAGGALALLGYLAFRERPQPFELEPPATVQAAAEPVALEPDARDAPELAPAVAERAPLEAAPANAPSKPVLPPAHPPVRRFAGRVVDPERRGVAGLEVRFEGSDGEGLPAERATFVTASAADGAFELPLPTERGRLVASGRGYATVLAPGLYGEMPPEPPLVFVAPALQYGGILVDVQGKPLPGIELVVMLADDRAQELRPGAFTHAVPVARGKSDAEGGFLFPDVGHVEGLAIEVAADGFQRLHFSLPDHDELELRVVLQPLDAGNLLAGRVRFGDGSAAAGAWVAAGEKTTRTEGDGSFALELEPGDTPGVLRAVYAGYLPAELDLGRVPREEWQTLMLEIASPALAITGTVVDAEGKPLEGAEVWTAQGEHLGMVSRRFGEVSFYLRATVEEAMSTSGDEWSDGRETSSARDGSFRLHGLLDRAYDVCAMHPVTQEIVVLPAVRAGRSGLGLVFQDREPAREVRGRVLNLAGEPVVGAELGVYRERRLADGTLSSKQASADFRAVTDENGAFRFERLCVSGTHLRLTGEMIASHEARALDQEPDLLDVVFRVPSACHLRVFLADPARADGIELLDQDGQTLMLTIFIDTISLSAQSVTLEGGVSDLIRTDETACTLVLTRGGQESERIPIHLKPGAVNEIRP